MRISILSCIQRDSNGNNLTHFHQLVSLFEIGIIEINFIQRIVPDKNCCHFVFLLKLVFENDPNCVQKNQHDSFKTMSAHNGRVCAKNSESFRSWVRCERTFHKVRISISIFRGWPWASTPFVEKHSIGTCSFEPFLSVHVWIENLHSIKKSSMMEIRQNRLFDVLRKSDWIQAYW